MRLNRVTVLIVVWALCFAQPARAADPLDVALAVASHILVPRYQQLQTAFRNQADAWQAGCADTKLLRAAFDKSADAWAAVEHGRFGPIARDNRPERISFWPDPRNATEKGLAQLSAAPDEAALAPERIVRASVAVQGLPALERILFFTPAPGAKPVLAKLSERQCAIGKAISANLANIGDETVKEWIEPQTGQLAKLESLRNAPDGLQQARAAATQILTDLATLFMIVADRKLLPLYGGKGKGPQPRASEAWRSGRSERNIMLNLDAASDTATVLKPFAMESADILIGRLKTAKNIIGAHDGNPPGFAGFASVKVAQYEAIQKLPAALDVPLGFNSLDGD